MLQQELTKAPAAEMEAFFAAALGQVSDEHWHTRSYRVGEHVVQYRIAGKGLQAFLSEAIMHIRTDAESANADLVIYAIDEKALGLDTPDAPWSWHTGDREGYFHGLDTDRFTVNFDRATQSLRLLDRQRNVALHWIRDMQLIPYWERSFPMRQILNWWYRDTAFQPLHAAAVGSGGVGALIGAKGGSGKSSTAISCLLSGMQFAGDDFILVDCHNPRAYSLYSIAKLEPHTLERFPTLRPSAGTPMIDQNKYQISLARIVPENLERVLDLRLILVPYITHGPETTLSPLEKSEASSALMLSTFYLLKGDTRAAFLKIQKLVDALPVYQLNLGLDFERIPHVIKRAIDDHR